MECQDVHATLAEYLAGALPPAAADDVAAHLRTCAACAAEADGLADTWDGLGDLPADVPDSVAMRARFLAVLEGYQQGARDAHLAGSRVRRVVAWWTTGPARRVGYGVAAAAVLFLGVVVGRQSGPSVAPASGADVQLAEVRQELRDMRQMMTLSLLQQQSASERLKGVTWTEQVEGPASEVTAALLDTLMGDPNVNVRLASIDALRRFAQRDVVRQGAIEALSRQTSPLVQMALIDFVVEVNGREAADTLRRLSTDAGVNAAVRARAAMGLEQVG